MEITNVHTWNWPEGRVTFFDVDNGACMAGAFVNNSDDPGKDKVRVKYLHTNNEFRRKGYATFLMKKIEERYAELGPARIEVDIDTRVPFLRPFFEKIGYRAISSHAEKEIPIIKMTKFIK